MVLPGHGFMPPLGESYLRRVGEGHTLAKEPEQSVTGWVNIQEGFALPPGITALSAS